MKNNSFGNKAETTDEPQVGTVSYKLTKTKVTKFFSVSFAVRIRFFCIELERTTENNGQKIHKLMLIRCAVFLL